MNHDINTCVICGASLPWFGPDRPSACYHGSYRVRTCHPECTNRLNQLSRDYSKSKRGRFLSKKELFARISTMHKAGSCTEKDAGVACP